jgi:hypothetical protein
MRIHKYSFIVPNSRQISQHTDVKNNAYLEKNSKGAGKHIALHNRLPFHVKGHKDSRLNEAPYPQG